MRGNEVIEYPADQNTLTKRYTNEVVKRLERLVQKARADIGDYHVKGVGQRTAGLVENNKL